MRSPAVLAWVLACVLSRPAYAGMRGALTDEAAKWCSGARKSQDAIVWLGQRKHSSYDATHANTLNASMASVREYYPAVRNADVLVWHEGDMSPRDADALSGATNVRWCKLKAETGWGARDAKQLAQSRKDERWHDGYLFMIRWYAATCWRTLEQLGYGYMMRFDDDSFVLSPIRYDVFHELRNGGHDYGFRTISRECDRTFSAFIDGYVQSRPSARFQLADDGTVFCEKFPRYCADGAPRHARAKNYQVRLPLSLRTDASLRARATATAPAGWVSTTTGSSLGSGGGLLRRRSLRRPLTALV
mmetsp:Transcript_11684/g.39072  ORF Transcript_11684/g.39072 Transcript_11684/m.39072 type:complete len:303 (-) Transcript_11684:426-1334(-)